jgi:hypothetical protein
MAVVIPDIKPTELLARFRGRVTSARPAYPDVLHLDVIDAAGGVWSFGTFEADYVPKDPDAFVDKSVVDADLDVPVGRLAIRFSDGSELNVVPFALKPDEVDEFYESWNLFTPDGFVLNYGPGDRWVLKRATDPL